METLAAAICRIQRLCKSGERLLAVAEALLCQTEAIVPDTEIGLRRDAARKRADGLRKRPLLEVGPPHISPGIFRGSVQDVLRQRAQHGDRIGVLFAVDQDDSQRVSRLAKVWFQIQRRSCMALGLFQPAFVNALTAEIEIDQGREVGGIRVLVVEVDGLEGMVERFARLAAIDPQVTGDVVLCGTTALVILPAARRLRR